MSEFGRFTEMMERARVRNATLLLEAATLLRDEHIRDLSGVNPGGDNPATKGEFPKQRTGDLRASVIMEPATLGEIMKTGKVRVGLKAGAKRPGALYHHGWKGVRDTMLRIRSQLRAILRGADHAG